MFIAQRAQTGGAQQEVSSGRRFEPDPAGGEHPQEVAARKKEHSRSGGSHPGQYAVSPRAHLVRRFTAWATVAEQLPLRPRDRKSTRLNSSHGYISYAVFCLKKKKKKKNTIKKNKTQTNKTK